MAVLVTRPDERGKQLTEMLNKAGIATIHLPFFFITPGRELNELPNKIISLKSGDYVVVVSKSVVRYADETLRSTGFRWRDDLHYFAVGQGSAEYFSSHSERAVTYPFNEENSEGMLKLDTMQHLEGKNLLLLRGNSGRELFSEQVKARGAALQVIECYQHTPISYDREEQTSLCKRAGVNTIIVTSVEILTLLMDFISKSEHNWIKSCRLITISRRIANLATWFGFERIIIAPHADNATLLQTVLAQTNS